jgi:hypothetical protein
MPSPAADAAGFAKSLGKPAGRAPFAHATLLHATVADDWSTWLKAAEPSGVDLGVGLKFDKVHVAFRAAAQVSVWR